MGQNIRFMAIFRISLKISVRAPEKKRVTPPLPEQIGPDPDGSKASAQIAAALLSWTAAQRRPDASSPFKFQKQRFSFYQAGGPGKRARTVLRWLRPGRMQLTATPRSRSTPETPARRNTNPPESARPLLTDLARPPPQVPGPAARRAARRARPYRRRGRA